MDDRNERSAKIAGAETENTPKRRGRAVGWIVALVILATLGGGAWYAATHVIYGGESIPKSTELLDYRARALTTQEYEDLRLRLPETEIRWSVPLSTGAVDSRAESLRIPALSAADRELLAYLPELRAVEFTSEFTDYPTALNLRSERPDLAVRWTVELGAERFPDDAESLTLPADTVDTPELIEKLAWLPEVSEISFTGTAMDYADLDALAAAWPEITVHAYMELCGQTLPDTAETLSLSGESVTEAQLADLRAHYQRFPALKTVDLTDCGLSDETLVALAADTGLDVLWYTELYGVSVCSLDEEIDLTNNQRVRDGGAAVEALLPGMHHLKKVIMSNCGIKNEDMDALDQRHEDVRFVWTVYFSIYSMRTDENNFIAARHVNHAELGSIECRVLKYCKDLIALDLGHKDIQELSFLYDLPKLQYLILAECTFGNIEPIGSLKELKYLEIFLTKVEHIEPLLNCTKLQDLNISYIYARHDNAYKVLVQMPWLERLWYCGNAMTEEEVASLQEALPNCEMYLLPHAESTGGGWREHPHYYEMRDVFGMYYMPGGTNGVAADGSQIVISG